MAFPISCLMTKNLLKSNNCSYTLNEITDIYVADFNSVSAANVDYSCESGVTVTGISATSTGKVFSHIEVAKNSASYSDELVVEDSGAKYRTHTVTFGIPGNYNKDIVCSIDTLALGRFFVVVQTAAGEYLALGRTAGLEASEQSIAGGGDTNGVTVTLTANVAESAIPLNTDAVAQMKELVFA